MPGDPPAVYTVTVPAEPDGLDHLHAVLEQARAERPDVDGTDLALLETAVIELAGNVARHGRPTGSTEVTLTLHVLADRLEATLVDAGTRFAVDVDAATLPDELDEAGRGIAMARLAVDELTYDHRDGVNTWFLRRRRA